MAGQLRQYWAVPARWAECRIKRSGMTEGARRALRWRAAAPILDSAYRPALPNLRPCPDRLFHAVSPSDFQTAERLERLYDSFPIIVHDLGREALSRFSEHLSKQPVLRPGGLICKHLPTFEE